MFLFSHPLNNSEIAFTENEKSYENVNQYNLDPGNTSLYVELQIKRRIIHEAQGNICM